MERAIEKIDEWATWSWVNVKIDKGSLALFKQIVNNSKDDMENYNWTMFTYAMNFFQKIHEFEKVDSITFLHKLIEQFVDKRFGNPW
jgi:hypothetical protein